MNSKKLIALLLDESANISERDDAAMDLSNYNSNEVMEGLLTIGMNENVDDTILYSVGESIAIIWMRNSSFDLENYQKLSKVSKFAIRDHMES